MSKIGIILTGFNCREYYAPCLDAWVRVRAEKFGGHEFVICAVSVKFAGFPDESDDGTTNLFRSSLQLGHIDHLIDGPQNIPEITARTMALNYLQSQNCDASIMVDLDEIYTTDNIVKILEFADANPFIAWFRFSLKNFVFNRDTYLAEPFQPPRFHRLKIGGYKANAFVQDNDIQYTGTITRDLKPQEAFPSLTIPKELVWVQHLSWLNGNRSKKKTEYQWKRWGNCSFCWDDAQGGLIFNPALPAPKVIRET